MYIFFFPGELGNMKIKKNLKKKNIYSIYGIKKN